MRNVTSYKHNSRQVVMMTDTLPRVLCINKVLPGTRVLLVAAGVASVTSPEPGSAGNLAYPSLPTTG